MSKILKISNLYKNYNTKKMEIEALKNVNIEINEGDFLGIVGPSGCGKSTLLSIIGGLESITKGSIEKKDNLKIGYMLQDDCLFPWLTIYENCLIGLKTNKTCTKENMENVKNFASHDNGHTLEVVKGTLEELGYTFFKDVLNAVDYGIPQNRERIYMVCFQNDLKIKDFSFPKAFPLKKHVEDFLLEDESLVENLYISRPDTYFNGVADTSYSNKPIRLGIVNKGGQGERIYSTKGIAITLSAYGGGIFAKTGGYLIHGRTRKLHPRECARIMGFPDSYKLCPSSSQAYKQFGNSVVIDVLQLIGIEIGKVLPDSES